jgi:hypothetical protein
MGFMRGWYKTLDMSINTYYMCYKFNIDIIRVVEKTFQ